jgi:hypothetical protein
VPRQFNSAHRNQVAPPAPRRQRLTSESIGWWTSATAAAYASFQEFLPTIVKAVAGTLLATAAAAGSFKAWKAKHQDGGPSRENR